MSKMRTQFSSTEIYFLFFGKLTFSADVPIQTALLWKSERHQQWALQREKKNQLKCYVETQPSARKKKIVYITLCVYVYIQKMLHICIMHIYILHSM